MAGIAVSKGNIDSKAADAVISIRNAFAKVEAISTWLANNPKDGDVDPLVSQFQYTADEAYLLRVVFESLQSINTNNANIFALGRKLTGLE